MYGQAKRLIADATTVPLWWQNMRDEHGRRYYDYVNFFGRDVLLRSLKLDMEGGAQPTKDILEHFPELNERQP